MLVKINSVDKVKEFVHIASKFDFELDLVSGRYVVDAKSIMGIFSLDLSRPIELKVHNQDERVLAEKELGKFKAV